LIRSSNGLMKSGSDFTGTVFNDTASHFNRPWHPPFTGTFAPARPLSRFAGTKRIGLWILGITNHSVDKWGYSRSGVWGSAFRSSHVVGGTPPNCRALYQLIQNFPNPFNPRPRSGMGFPGGPARDADRPSNALGEKVATLADGEEEADTTQARLDGGSLCERCVLLHAQGGTYSGRNG